jgi:FtsZ-interacting cell division protein ZipA
VIPLAAIPWRLIGVVVAALAIIGLFMHDRWMVKRYEHQKAANATLQANLNAERENTRKANESARRYASRISVSRGPRSPPARIMCKLPSVPQAAATSRADDAAPPDDTGVHEAVDIGPRIDVPFRACEENLIKLDELQRWIRDR